MKRPKLQNITELYDILPDEELLMVDVLRQFVKKNLPENHTEKLAYNVPFFYGNRRICLIWPSTIPFGGIKKGVLFGFCYGNLLKDEEHYLKHGTNKQVFYKIYGSIDEIDFISLEKLLNEAVTLDQNFNKKKFEKK